MTGKIAPRKAKPTAIHPTVMNMIFFIFTQALPLQQKTWLNDPTKAYQLRHVGRATHYYD